jgi:hypothetical protein
MCPNVGRVEIRSKQQPTYEAFTVTFVRLHGLV